MTHFSEVEFSRTRSLLRNSFLTPVFLLLDMRINRWRDIFSTGKLLWFFALIIDWNFYRFFCGIFWRDLPSNISSFWEVREICGILILWTILGSLGSQLGNFWVNFVIFFSLFSLLDSLIFQIYFLVNEFWRFSHFSLPLNSLNFLFKFSLSLFWSK